MAKTEGNRLPSRSYLSRPLTLRGTMFFMATKEQTQVSVEVMAARLRVKADRRLKRETPADIKAMAEDTRSGPTTKSA